MGIVGSLDRLGGLLLRYELCIVLHEARRSLTVAEIVRWIEDDGFAIGPNPQKVVADALRWEVRRGRARRVRRGVYATGRLPRSSESKMRAALQVRRAEMASVGAGRAGLAAGGAGRAGLAAGGYADAPGVDASVRRGTDR